MNPYLRTYRICWMGLLVGLLAFACQSPEKKEASTRGLDNVITQENQQPGTTDWLLTKTNYDTCKYYYPKDAKFEWARNSPPELYYCRSANIEGYCSRTSVQAGDTLSLFVSTAPASDYTVDFYRLGYYQGKGGRLMQKAGPFKGITQPVPEDGEKQLRECQWQKSYDLTIPESWTSGVYLGKLTALRDSSQSYVIFIVNDSRKADFLFQCSDMTWQAYNRWPEWRSLYDWENWIWTTSGGPNVSFDRPYAFYYNGLPSRLNPLTNGSGEFLLWEFPLAFWMEKEGYDVTYISNMDTHEHPETLLRGKGFLSVGHDEYWTRQMFDHVTQARDAGLSLVFLSGNALDGEVFLRTSNDGHKNRIMGRAKHFTDEQELMGASSYGVGLGSWICEAPNHWLFEGTGLQKGDSIPHLVGWEFHGAPLRKDTSLIVLASGKFDPKYTPSEVDSPAATIYSGPQKNFVFNAATCWWSLFLSTPPGYQNPPNKDFSKGDKRVQRMTKNLFERIANQSWPQSKGEER